MATLGLLALLAVALWAVVGPWLRPDIQWRDVADAPNHLVRLYVVDAALDRGEWYPRWLRDLYLGYGYPLLSYYAPGTYYLGWLLHRAGATVYASFQWAGALAAALGAGGAFALVRAVAGRRDGALVAALAFLLAPYPFLTNLYVRGAVPEALGIAVVPWVMLGAWGAWRHGGWWPWALAASTAALLLVHNVSALLGMGMVALWALALPGLRPPAGGRAWPAAAAGVLGGLALGVALSAFFWLPAVAEGKDVQLTLAQDGFYSPRGWLFDPFGRSGGSSSGDYPHSRLGPADMALVFDYNALGRGFPEKISAPQLLVLALAFSAALAVLVTARRRAPVGARPPEASGPLPPPALAVTALGALLVAGVCWYLNTIWSQAVWEGLPVLPLVQFPWRLYGPLALAGAIAAGVALAALPFRPAVAWLARLAAVLGLGLLAYGSLAARPFTTGPQPAHDVDQRDVAALEYNRFGAGTTSGGEFLPRTVSWEPQIPTVTKRGIKLYDDHYPQAAWQAGLVEVLSGSGAVPAIWQQRDRIGAQVEAATPLRLGVHQLAFPGWRAYLDGRPLPLTTVPTIEELEASLGFMVLEVPPGTHRVEVVLGPTPARLAGRALSAGAAGAGLLWLAFALLPSGGRRRMSAVQERVGLCAAAALLAAGAAVALARWEARPQAAPPAGAARVVLDVAGAVRRGTTTTSAPSGIGTGVLPPYLDVGEMAIAGLTRRWVYMHPPSQVTVPVRVPAHAYFQAGTGLDPRTWTTETGDGVRFILEAEAAGARRTLLDRPVNPRARGEDRGWVDLWVDLKEYAGQDVRLTLRTDAAQDPTFDWAGWANPQVVVWDAARPDPGAPHKW